MTLLLIHHLILLHVLVNVSASRIHPLDMLHDLVDDEVIGKFHDMPQLVLINHRTRLIHRVLDTSTLHPLQYLHMVQCKALVLVEKRSLIQPLYIPLLRNVLTFQQEL